MTPQDILGDFGPLASRFFVDLVAMTILVFGLYYRRYRDKSLATASALFNLFTFAVLTVLSTVEFSVAAGFGLFAILALFSLRSEPIGKTEITYFFGAVTIAVICSIGGTSLAFVIAAVTSLLVGAWIIDHPSVLPSAGELKLTLERIDEQALADPASMREALSHRLGVDVMAYQIASLDYTNDLAQLRVFYRKLEG